MGYSRRRPELFDRLYGDWSTLERFQRTRGVLRLMSAVINALWQAGDAAPLIMPGGVPLDSDRVRSELTQYLEDDFKPIIDTGLDAGRGGPVQVGAGAAFGDPADRPGRLFRLGGHAEVGTQGD